MSLDSTGQNSMIFLKPCDIPANSTLSLFIYLASAAIKIDEAEALLFFSKEKYPFIWLCPQCQLKLLWFTTKP